LRFLFFKYRGFAFPFFSKFLQPGNGILSQREGLNTDVDPLNEVIKTLDCFKYKPKTCASKGVKTSNTREQNNANGSNAERKSQKKGNAKPRYLKKRKRKSQKNEQEFNYGKSIKLELKTEEVFGGRLLFSNVNGKIRAAHWKNDHTVEHLKCGFNNWGFEKKQEANHALEEYVICQNLEIYKNLWVATPSNIGSVAGDYDTEKKSKQSIEHSKIQENAAKSNSTKMKTQKKTEEKSAIQRNGPFAEQIDAKQDYENVKTIKSVGQTQDSDEKGTANTLTESELLFQEIMRKYDKEVSGEKIQPKKKKYFTLEQLKAKTSERKHSDESEDNHVETKKKSGGHIILNYSDSSDEFELNPDEYRDFFPNQNNFNEFDLSDPYSSYHDQEKADDQKCSTKNIKADNVAKIMKLRDIASFLPKISSKMKMIDTRLSKYLDDKEDYGNDSTDKSSRKEYSGTINGQKACRQSVGTVTETTDKIEETDEAEAHDVQAFLANIRHEFIEMKSKITKLSKWKYCLNDLDCLFYRELQKLCEKSTVNENSNISAIYKWRKIAEITLQRFSRKKLEKIIILSNYQSCTSSLTRGGCATRRKRIPMQSCTKKHLEHSLCKKK
jgi:hypothetical protein